MKAPVAGLLFSFPPASASSDAPRLAPGRLQQPSGSRRRAEAVDGKMAPSHTGPGPGEFKDQPVHQCGSPTGGWKRRAQPASARRHSLNGAVEHGRSALVWTIQAQGWPREQVCRGSSRRSPVTKLTPAPTLDRADKMCGVHLWCRPRSARQRYYTRQRSWRIAQ